MDTDNPPEGPAHSQPQVGRFQGASPEFPLTQRGVYIGLPQTVNYGPVYNIGTAENVSAGVSYGPVIMNSDSKDFMSTLFTRLKVSVQAAHRYYACGDEKALRRSSCTPGTRVTIIKFIIRWATDTSPGSEPIYWLSGQAGAGKTTIAYTIARHFETLVGDGNSSVILGGSFFCSRQLSETRIASAIIRTIVYQLALRSNTFRNALKEHAKLEMADYGPRSQLMGLLVGPWKMSAQERQAEGEPCYIIPIDALDELEGTGGTQFLSALLEVVEQQDLPGLKFFVTSRLDPALVERIEAFPNKQVCRLAKVPIEQSNADIRLYLNAKLSQCATTQQIQQLVSDAAGLFIYAATVVEYVERRTLKEQKRLLNQLLSASSSPVPRPSLGATEKLDKLYLQILDTSLVDPRDNNDLDVFQDCLWVLHTFLCTLERTSIAVAAAILTGSSEQGGEMLFGGIADGVLDRLHAVLYSHGDQVMWFHKSFADFLFDKRRSQRFFCDQECHHRRLAYGCFGIMGEQLRFNIANIPSSFQLDYVLPTRVETNISKPLMYACGNWSAHLTLTSLEGVADLAEVLSKFLQLRVLFWMESMNLLGQRGRCQGMLRDAQQWLLKSKDHIVLIRELADAASFALYHSTGGGALSTPHLYISSLPTFHRRSALLQRWRQILGGIPTFVSAQRAAGEALVASFVAGNNSTAFAVSADGGNIASGSEDGSVRLWNLATGEKVKTLQVATRKISTVAYSPLGTHVAAGSDDKLVQVWDLSSGEAVHIFKGHAGGVRAVAYSPDGACIVSGSFDKSVRLWDLSTGTETKVFRGHRRRVCAVAFSPDGDRVVSGADDGSALVWDAATGGQVMSFSGHTGGVHAVAFSPDSTYVVSGSSDHSVQVWAWSTGEGVATLRGHTGPVCALAFSPEGTHVVSGSSDQSIRVWDISTGQAVNTLEGHRGAVCAVAYPSHGTHIVSGSTDQSVRVWDSSLGEEDTALKGHTIGVNSLAYSPSDNRVVCGMEDASVWIWDLSSGELLSSLKRHTHPVRAVAYSPDGAFAVSGSDDESVRVWDLSTGQGLITLEGHSDKVWGVAYSPDGASVVSASRDGTVRLWDLASGEEVKTFRGHTDWVQTVAYSPQGGQIASGSKDKSVGVWDLEAGDAVKTLLGHSGAVNAVAYTPNGMHVVSASEDKTVRVWDVMTGEELNIFEGHTGRVTAVCCSPDGNHAVSGSDDRSIRIWELATGAQVMVLRGHTDVVTAVTYSPNGNHVVSASLDTSVRVWDVSPQYLRRYTRQEDSNGTYTGWLVSPTDPSTYLMFVPPETLLPDDTNVLTLPASAVSHVDFSQAKIGHGWGASQPNRR